jgi:SNF2 family DNA or RNA helicase
MGFVRFCIIGATSWISYEVCGTLMTFTSTRSYSYLTPIYLQSFGRRFQTPIEDARSKDATKFQIQAGQKANEELQKKLRPYLLQRLKVDNMADELPTKSDFVVWTHISQTQREMYETYINAKDSAVADILSGLKTSPLEAVTWLKKLCGHPILVSDKLKNSAATLPPSELIRYSSKLQVLDALVEDLRKNGHRMLIFSQSTKMLDIIQRVLLERVHGLSRIDGQTKERDRQRFVDEFNEKGSTIEVMLLSTGAGGTGLTLTGADRAIIYDPSWSPAQDAQAVDRCYRIGQEKPVSVYRLIAAGTVEEKVRALILQRSIGHPTKRNCSLYFPMSA